MAEKKLPFTKDFLENLVKTYPTPFHIYDEKAIRENAKKFIKAFSWNEGFKEYFAVKALPNPFILKILKEEGFGADCSSMAELHLAEAAGITGENIILTSNNTPANEYKKAKELGAILNLDDISHLDYIQKNVGLPNILSFRYNPGSGKDGNSIIGKPEEAKYGFTHDQMIEGYSKAKEMGITRFGIHTMVASNELDAYYFIDTADILFSLMVEIHQKTGIRFEFANLGGGIGIPYRPNQKAVDLDFVSKGIKDLYEKHLVKNGLAPVRVCFESGRMITGPYGYLVTRVQHFKNTYKRYAGVDANMSDLMRPGMYGAYHHITIAGKENQANNSIYDITGSLCENNDKFAIDRPLPDLEIGDFLVLHDTGAHGHAMGFNYNGKLRAAELLLRPNSEVKQIRRAETLSDYFATLDLNSVSSWK